MRTRAHWLVLGAVLVGLGVALFVHGLTHGGHDVAQDAAAPPGPAGEVPSEVIDGGPAIDASAGGVRTAEPRSRSIALTFDDGPDPRWTPRILDLLREYGVRATFFVVGTSVIDHPQLLQRIIAEGHEVGLHSLTHSELGSLPSWQRELEMRWTQQAVIGASGQSTSIFRPPYSSTNQQVTDSTWSVIRAGSDDGYLTVLSTDDSRDWTRPGVAQIVANSRPHGTAGEVLLMHDGGGDRSQTVEALSSLLPELQADGYDVTTVSDAIGLAGTMQQTPVLDRIAGTALITGVQLSELVMSVITVALLASGVIILLRAVLVIAAAAHHVRTTRRPAAETIVLDPVTVIVPAYDEALGIEAAVRSIAASTHDVEIIVVDDGSTDGTADIVEGLCLDRVRLIRRRNGGKPTALNAGLREARHDLIVMVDGDTVLEPDAVRRLVQPMADPAVGAVSGNTKVANRQGILGAWQHIEYVVGFNLDRRLFDVAECMPTVPGAIGAFRREALTRVGGVSDETLAEDTDLTMALCRDGWRVVYRSDAIAWTEAPATIDALWKQRYRWCYGTLQAMWKHRGAVRQRGQAGKLGRRGLSYLLLLQVLLPLFAPVVDLFALYGLIFLDPLRIIGLWCGFLLVQLLMALYAFALDRESPRSLWSLPLQQFVYRQLMYLVVIQSVFTAFAGTHLRWHRMERYGSLREPVATTR